MIELSSLRLLRNEKAWIGGLDILLLCREPVFCALGLRAR
jgi:hypothetical protein